MEVPHLFVPSYLAIWCYVAVVASAARAGLELVPPRRCSEAPLSSAHLCTVSLIDHAKCNVILVHSMKFYTQLNASNCSSTWVTNVILSQPVIMDCLCCCCCLSWFPPPPPRFFLPLPIFREFKTYLSLANSFLFPFTRRRRRRGLKRAWRGK